MDLVAATLAGSLAEAEDADVSGDGASEANGGGSDSDDDPEERAASQACKPRTMVYGLRSLTLSLISGRTRIIGPAGSYYVGGGWVVTNKAGVVQTTTAMDLNRKWPQAASAAHLHRAPKRTLA